MTHIMRHYSNYGFTEFVVAIGYLGERIVEYFSSRGKAVPGPSGCVRIIKFEDTDWVIDLVDTDLDTNTGGRLKRLAPFLGDTTFMLTWGDGLSDINFGQQYAFHRSHGCLATLTSVHPPPRFGRLKLDQERVVSFAEKETDPNEWINGAFFVLEPGVFEYIDGDKIIWEKEPLQNLSRDNQLMAFRHTGFWQCMDTLYEKQLLNDMWTSGNSPWLHQRGKS